VIGVEPQLASARARSIDSSADPDGRSWRGAQHKSASLTRCINVDAGTEQVKNRMAALYPT